MQATSTRPLGSWGGAGTASTTVGSGEVSICFGCEWDYWRRNEDICFSASKYFIFQELQRLDEVSTEGFEAADKEALLLSELAAVVQVQTGPIERISAFASLKEHLVSFHYETCLCTCPLNCKSLFRHSGCLLLLITKLAQAREALEAKREEEQARLEVRTSHWEGKTLNSQHFSKNQEEEKKMPAGEGKQAGGKRGCKTQ